MRAGGSTRRELVSVAAAPVRSEDSDRRAPADGHIVRLDALQTGRAYGLAPRERGQAGGGSKLLLPFADDIAKAVIGVGALVERKKLAQIACASGWGHIGLQLKD